MIDKLTVQVSTTSDGRHQFLQISSPAAMPVNIVLIADEIVIDDRRAATISDPESEAGTVT